MTDITSRFTMSQYPNAENLAFTRYADKVHDPKFERVF